MKPVKTLKTVYKYTTEDLKRVSSKDNRKHAKYLIELLHRTPRFNGRRKVPSPVKRAVVCGCSRVDYML